MNKKSEKAINDIWKNIIRPHKTENIGNSIKFNAYTSYCYFHEKQSSNNEIFSDIDFEKKTIINLEKNSLNTMQPLLGRVFKNLNTFENYPNDYYEQIFVWGAKLFKIEPMFEMSLKNPSSSFYFIEDGFYRSVTGSLVKTNLKYSISHSLIFDDLAPHYDGNHVSRLEKILQDDSEEYLSKSEEIQELKDYIITNKLTKYNDQPIYRNLRLGYHKNKVLVVLQSFLDASMTIVSTEKNPFERMINDAINENPDSDIIVKVHPDTIIKGNKSFVSNLYKNTKIIIIDYKISLPDLIQYCNKVYVFSSQAGFEALLWNKEVIVYGKPFYAGWGLTVDKNNFNRKNISFDKMFYDIHFRYTKYFNPNNGNVVAPIEALQDIKNLRNKFNKITNNKILIIKLDGIGDFIIFEQCLRALLSQSDKYKKSELYLLADVGIKEYVETCCTDIFTKRIYINKRNSKIVNLFKTLKLSQKKKLVEK